MKLFVEKNRYALIYRNEKLIDIQTAGKYSYYSRNLFFDKYSTVFVPMHDGIVSLQDIDTLLESNRELIEKFFYVVEVKANTLCKIEKNSLFTHLLQPGIYLFGKHVRNFSQVMITIEQDYALDQAFFQNMSLENRTGCEIDGLLYTVHVPEYHVGILLSSSGKTYFLQPGIHTYPAYKTRFSHKVIDMRNTTLELNGQEILTKDTVSLRINGVINYVIQDAKSMFEKIVDYTSFIYQVAQLELRAIVAQKTLEELLNNKALLGKDWLVNTGEKLLSYGILVDYAGIKDIIFPGEMKELMNKVILAEKDSQANAIKRRDDTANMRSLLNTAKLLDEHPKLARLKELEVLEKMLSKVNSVSINQSVEGLLHKLVSLE